MTSFPNDPFADLSKAEAMYLSLLARVLTNTLEEPEPDVDEELEARFVGMFLKHYMRGPAISMLPQARIRNILGCIQVVEADNIPGDFIETGVWRGGGALFMRATMEVLNIRNRTVWAADSFEGLPEPDPEQFPLEAERFHGSVIQKGYDKFAASLEEVQGNFQKFGLLDDRVKFLKGWFCDTLPEAPIDQLAIMRLDGDYYESTMDALNALYAKLATGGFVIIDDYGEDSWTNCRQAVDHFREEHGIVSDLVRADSKCYFWRKV